LGYWVGSNRKPKPARTTALKHTHSKPQMPQERHPALARCFARKTQNALYERLWAFPDVRL